MKKTLILCFIVLCTQVGFALVKSTSADTATALDSLNQEKHDARWLKYEDERKEPLLAVGAAWLLPSAGHAYAGDWGRGVPFLLADIACIGIAISGIQTVKSSNSFDTPSGTASYSTTNTKITGAYFVGLGLLVAVRVWEYFDAYDTAEEHNKQLQKELNLTDEEIATHERN